MIIAIPNKGRLKEPCINLLTQAGIRPEIEERRLISPTNNPRINLLFARARDIPEFVARGSAEVGITGYDMVLESNADVEVLLKLGFGNAKLVVAAPSGAFSSVDELEGKRVATEFGRITREYFTKRGINVEVVEVSGACENAPAIGIADAIVDLVSTGITLRMNGLEVLDVVIESEAVLIANRNAVESFEVRALTTALQSVINARGRMYLMMNVPEEALEEVKRIVPGLKGPTVMKVEAEGMLAVHVVVAEEELFEVVEKLKKIGARDILIMPVQRLIY
ncbi:ATP phosphoribosyltransferase [Archaeoglobus veneficus]|uniref:ATP phosphoribosyltransferase n=1 Tax=Archaeoglobus veneficus (strain DSM 11195 / SNP6) TaxID=693661 RepID=F2KRS3_ARCVS|nr:ATP phosphoribosyltransferase [Archaeoglobus veneficus]AEA47937.1 ATP phosphoribosyltransferase [Archaeoglobus veneficus SNP6]